MLEIHSKKNIQRKASLTGVALFGMATLTVNQIKAASTNDNVGVTRIRSERQVKVVFVDKDTHKTPETQAFLDTQAKTLATATGFVYFDPIVPDGYVLADKLLYSHIFTYVGRNEHKVVYIPVVHQTVHIDNDWLDYLTNLSYEFYDSQDQEINENFDTYKIAWLQERDLATKQTRYIPYSGRITGLRLTKLPTVELPTLPYVKYSVNNGTETRSLGGFWVSFSSNYQLVDGALLELPPENIRVTINEQANNETEKPVMAILVNPRTLVINQWIPLIPVNPRILVINQNK